MAREATATPPPPPAPDFDIAPNDPIVAYFQSASGVVDVDQLEMDSPALRAMKEANIKLVVPLVSQGELIGLLNLGPRLSEQEYSSDDRALLNNLAAQATPAVRVAQLVREQQAEAQERERIEQELRVARLIQHTLLPKTVPDISGWELAAYYQPAREVGGDFYDFIELPEGRLGLVVGDVTDKGVPAALVMATTRTMMRATAGRYDSPGEVLARVNDVICPDIPENMFVTCLYAVLDPATGKLRYANAGHDVPYHRHGEETCELRARGMPLGLMQGMTYEEKEAVLEPGDAVLFYSDGLVEAHNPQREMFGFPRLQEMVAKHNDKEVGKLVDVLLADLDNFTGPHWEQEDDITLVTLGRAQGSSIAAQMLERTGTDTQDGAQVLSKFEVPSQPGNERLAISGVQEAVRNLQLPQQTLDRLGTAVGEATMNAMEHGNKFRTEVPVELEVVSSNGKLVVRISDQGGLPTTTADVPDLEAKLANEQTPRGWGLFLIKNMVDEMNVSGDETRHTVELVVNREGNSDANTTV